MGFSAEILGFSDELETFADRLDAIDPETVKRESMKRIASEMVLMVIKAIKDEDRITSPAMNSKYDRGPGSSLVTKQAWTTARRGNSYIVTPKARQRERAINLNFGWDRVTPDGDGPLRFYVDGEPVFAQSTKGFAPTNYFSSAFDMLERSGRVEEILEQELQDEVDEKV